MLHREFLLSPGHYVIGIGVLLSVCGWCDIYLCVGASGGSVVCVKGLRGQCGVCERASGGSVVCVKGLRGQCGVCERASGGSVVCVKGLRGQCGVCERASGAVWCV